jgi:pyruvate dehydrogenase E2 component (dihydrolipoamide acetyltransferase)
MPSEITMPQLSDTMTEGTLVKWNKREGEKVKAGEEIAEVETDKATMPMEAFEGGTLAVVKAKEGDKVAVGALLGVIATSGENVEEVKKQYAGNGSAAEAKAASAPKKAEESAGDAPPKPAAQGVATAEPPPTQQGGNGHEEGRVKASPLARRIAADMGIDLSQVTGTGPEGRVVERDVREFKPGAVGPRKPAPSGVGVPAKADKKSGPPPISLAPKIEPGEKESVPLKKIRLVIAQRLQQSKQQIPHFYETIDVDVEELSRLREQMNRALEAEGVRLSLGDLISKGIATALLVHPALNAHFNGTEITRFGDVNLGMAVALPDGLIVPVLRSVNTLSLREIREKSTDLVERARKQSLKQSEMTGATFTVSNLGTYGVRDFAAIINPPEVAILAVGAAEPRAVVRDGQVVPRTMMSLTISADHRAVDGAAAAEFLRTLKTLLEQPGMMLV